MATKLSTDTDAVCRYWNRKGVVKHRAFTDRTKRKVKAALRYYDVGEICKAIFNYANILNDNQYFWTYRWTLHDFLQRGLEKFLDEAHPYTNFKSTYPVNGNGKAHESKQTLAYRERFQEWKKATPDERRVLETRWREGL